MSLSKRFAVVPMLLCVALSAQAGSRMATLGESDSEAEAENKTFLRHTMRDLLDYDSGVKMRELVRKELKPISKDDVEDTEYRTAAKQILIQTVMAQARSEARDPGIGEFKNSTGDSLYVALVEEAIDDVLPMVTDESAAVSATMAVSLNNLISEMDHLARSNEDFKDDAIASLTKVAKADIEIADSAMKYGGDSMMPSSTRSPSKYAQRVLDGLKKK